jgi:hypothetical protein
MAVSASGIATCTCTPQKVDCRSTPRVSSDDRLVVLAVAMAHVAEQSHRMQAGAEQQRAAVGEHGGAEAAQRGDDLVGRRAYRCRELDHAVAQLPDHSADQGASAQAREQLVRASPDAMCDRIDEEQLLLDREPEWGSYPKRWKNTVSSASRRVTTGLPCRQSWTSTNAPASLARQGDRLVHRIDSRSPEIRRRSGRAAFGKIETAVVPAVSACWRPPPGRGWERTRRGGGPLRYAALGSSNPRASRTPVIANTRWTRSGPGMTRNASPRRAADVAQRRRR